MRNDTSGMVLTTMVLALAWPFLSGQSQPASRSLQQAQQYLADALADENRRQGVLIALAATEDPAIAPILEAMANSTSTDVRRFAVTALGRLAPASAWPVLRQRLAKDSFAVVRAEALAQLLEANQATREDLLAAVNDNDERVQSLAARGLAQMGEKTHATPALEKLSQSSSRITSSTSQLALVAVGQERHLPALVALAQDSRTPETLLGLLLGQIEQEKSAQLAADFIKAVIDKRTQTPMQVAAWSAMASTGRHSPQLLKAIESTDDTVLAVNLLEVYCRQADADEGLAKLAAREDSVGLLAKLERQRRQQQDFTSQARQAAATGHPVVTDYLLQAAQADLAKADLPAAASQAWQATLLNIIEQSPDTGQMRAAHYRAARACTLLVDHGSDDSVGKLRQMLEARFSPRVRAVAAGLLRAKDKRAVELAKPLLQSPYDELLTDAALTLGRFGDPAASSYCDRILIRHEQSPVPVVAMAAWYTVKIAGAEAATAKALAQSAK